jgi:hypothetical protein
MAFIPTPSGVEIVDKGIQNGVPVVNVYHVAVAGVITSTVLLNVATVFKSWVDGYKLPMLDSSFVQQSVTAKDISVANGNEQTINYTSGGNGTAGNAPMAANAAVVVSWRTYNTGRSFRGRTYLGGLEQTYLLNAQNLTTSAATSIAAAMGALQSLLTSAGYILSVLSLVADKVARVSGLLTTIIGIVVDTKIDSQRRRTAN